MKANVVSLQAALLITSVSPECLLRHLRGGVGTLADVSWCFAAWRNVCLLHWCLEVKLYGAATHRNTFQVQHTFSSLWKQQVNAFSSSVSAALNVTLVYVSSRKEQQQEHVSEKWKKTESRLAPAKHCGSLICWDPKPYGSVISERKKLTSTEAQWSNALNVTVLK